MEGISISLIQRFICVSANVLYYVLTFIKECEEVSGTYFPLDNTPDKCPKEMNVASYRSEK